MNAISKPGTRPRSGLGWLLVAVLVIGSVTGCGTRYARQEIIDRRFVTVDLVSQKEGLFQTVDQGYAHPAIISSVRLVHILNAVEVETPQEGGGFIREPVLYPELVEKAAVALSEAFTQANPNQAIGIKLIHKEAKFGIFHTKFLTSFLAFIKDDYLYLSLSRVNWPIPQPKEAKKLPEPRLDETPMNFRVVSGDPLFYAGPQALEIAWRDPVFQNEFHLPGTAGDGQRRKEILLESPIPKEELRATEEGSTTLDQLSPEQLRALADLEEDRDQGRITESAYQRAKRQLMRSR